MLHLNTNQFVFGCSPGIIGMRYTWPVISFDLRCESVTYKKNGSFEEKEGGL